ncbi:hypothetical protein B296_00058441, partial [Ensete ventricosum]
MHPLRFPNSGIRVKVFIGKISFKLRVMRLNHVESFYVFLLRFRSEEEGQLGMARPSAKGAVGYGQAPCKGRSPAGATVARGHDRLRLAGN